MRGAIPSLPQYAFMVCCSVKKAQGQLYLYLYLTAIATRNSKNVEQYEMTEDICFP
jgi:hypothetical protein